jgi:hypothetical protein
MEPELPRPGLHGSALVGLLAQLALMDGPATAPHTVQGLGRWLGWEDAISLAAALQTPDAASLGLTSPARARKLALQLQRDLLRLRTDLGRALAQRDSYASGTGFAPYRQRYGALQQAMAQGIGPLRAQARVAVALVSPQMNRLAAMDAVVGQALGGREQALLAMLPTLLEKHFLRLRQAHEAAAADPAATAAASTATSTATPGSGGWLDTFEQDMQRMLLAELDLRLLPLQGLLDTLQTLNTTHTPNTQADS